jgi:hypothetical protein
MEQSIAHPKEETWPYAKKEEQKLEKQLTKREKLTTRREKLITRKEKLLKKQPNAVIAVANLHLQLACAQKK